MDHFRFIRAADSEPDSYPNHNTNSNTRGNPDTNRNPNTCRYTRGNADPNTGWNTDPKSDSGIASHQPVDSSASSDR